MSVPREATHTVTSQGNNVPGTAWEGRGPLVVLID